MFSSFRRKAKPAHIARPEHIRDVASAFPAGQPAHENKVDRQPVLTPRMHPRPRSSIYSQASMFYPSNDNPWTDPSEPIPAIPSKLQTPLTPTAVQLLNRQNADSPGVSEWEDESVSPASPESTPPPSQYMAEQQHSAVSEYTSNRSWIEFHDTPTTSKTTSKPPSALSTAPGAPSSPPPSVPKRSIRQLFPFSSDRPISSRRASTRSNRSSVTTLSYPGYNDEVRSATETMPKTPVSPSPLRAQRQSMLCTPSLTFSPTRDCVRQAAHSPTSYPPATPTVTATGRSYSQSCAGPSPVQVSSLNSIPLPWQKKQGKDIHPSPSFALPRGLSNKYGPKYSSAPVPQGNEVFAGTINQGGIPVRRASMRHVTCTSTANSRATAPPSYTTNTHYNSHPHHTKYPSPFSNATSCPLLTHTRDPTQTSDEGIYLLIGTLRGPTPSGLRQIHATMQKSIEKSGGTEKGVKEVRKWLKHETRGVIEWTSSYLKARWGADL